MRTLGILHENEAEKVEIFQKLSYTFVETPKLQFLSKFQPSMIIFDWLVASLVHFSKTRFSKENDFLLRFWPKILNNCRIFQNFRIFGIHSLKNHQSLIFGQIVGNLKHFSLIYSSFRTKNSPKNGQVLPIMLI